MLTKTIELRGARYHVIGVARPGFTGHAVGHPSDLWVPLTAESALMPDARLLEDRWGTGAQWLRIIGRLRTASATNRLPPPPISFTSGSSRRRLRRSGEHPSDGSRAPTRDLLLTAKTAMPRTEAGPPAAADRLGHHDARASSSRAPTLPISCWCSRSESAGNSSCGWHSGRDDGV